MNYLLQIRLAQLLQQKPSNLLSSHQLFQLHSQLIISGLQSPLLLSLLKLYLSNPFTLSHANNLFPQIQEPSKWNLIIRHASTTNPLNALSLFQEMQTVTKNYNQSNNFHIDPFIYASLVKACNKTQAIREGKSIHTRVIKLGLDYNVNILNSLVSFYMGSANLVSYATVLFDSIMEKSVVSINCMISGNVNRGNLDVGLRLFIRMLSGSFGSNLKSNYVTFVILISGCVEFGGYRTGNVLHCCCFKLGLERSTEICNALIDFYAKFGCVSDAASVFRDTPEKDLVSWNSMIWGYANKGDWRRAFSLFRKMRVENVGVDRASFSCLLSACVGSRNHQLVRMIHAHVKAVGLECDISVGTALINVYARCINVDYARNFFDELPKQNIEYLNAIIHAYIDNGRAREALKLLEQIKYRQLQLDEVTILGLIMACRDAGELQKGILVHSIVENNDRFKGSVVLQNALIDMYAKCGSTEKARGVFDKMSVKDVISWTSMIVGHAINGEGSKSLATFRRMCAEKFVPNSITFVGVLLGCDHAGKVDEGVKLYHMMYEVYRIKPKIEHFGCVVDMLARAGKIEDALMFIRKMAIEPNALVWRMLMNACRVHGHINLGLNLVAGITELNGSCESTDFVLSSNFYAEAGRWVDVISRRNVRKTSKEAGKSSVYYLTE